MDTHWSNLVLHYCDLNKYQPSTACSKDTEEKNLARHLNNPDVWMKSEMWWLFNKEIRMFTITELNLHRKRSLFPDFFSNPKKPGFKPNLRMWVFLWICRKDYFWTFHTYQHCNCYGSLLDGRRSRVRSSSMAICCPKKKGGVLFGPNQCDWT